MKRRAFITLMGGLAIAWPLASFAQQPKRPLKRVGVLTSLVPCPLQSDNLIVRRLGELGWIEGQNFVFECISGVGHYGHLDQLAALARELVSRRPDVLMAGPIPFVGALKQETTTIPIVMLGTSVVPHLVTNLARPEGNITGVSTFQGGIMPKRVEILKEMVPQLRRLAIIAATVDPKSIESLEEIITFVAGKLGFAWQRFQPIVANDYDEIFARLAAQHFDAAYIIADPLSTQNIARIGQLALRHRISTVGEFPGWANDGLLLTYGQNLLWTTSRAMDYVDKILRGAKPGELPVEEATKLELGINLKAAKTLGLTVPPSLIARADEVIDAGGATAVWSSRAQAQQRTMQTIGWLSLGSEPSMQYVMEAFRFGLADLGYTEGKNIRVLHRFADGNTDRLSALTRELVSLGATIIVTASTTAIRAAHDAAPNVPIVAHAGSNPVAMGWAQTLARPGGMITGVFQVGTGGKPFELLKEVRPQGTTFGFLMNATNPGNPLFRKAADYSARTLGIKVEIVEVKHQSELVDAFDRMVSLGVAGLAIIPDPVLGSNAATIAKLALMHKLPSVGEGRWFVAAGGLFAFDENYLAMARRSAWYVDQILKGIAPGDLAAEQSVDVKLFVNLKTAKELGITIPPSVFARADEVIE